MADNVVLSAGTADGVTLATDDVGGVHYQIVKLTYGALDSQTIVSTSNGLPVAQQGTWNITNVSGTVSLPTGAATAAKQPALGTAGSASADVISVQGIAAMTPLKVDGSGVTQPVSGTVNAAQSGTWTVQPGNTANTTAWLVNDAGAAVSAVNSTTSVLAGNATFTGTSEDVSSYASATVSLIASHASATDGLSIQQSSDGTNWDITDVYTVPAATGKTFGVQVAAKFFRIVYTNGATLQTSFRLQTIFHKFMPNASSVRPQDARSNENDMAEVIGYAALFNGATWDRMRGDTTNGLDVDVTRVTGTVSANVAQMNGVTVTMGNGVAGTGVQRVAIASDNTAFSVNATTVPATSGGLTVATGSITATATSIKGSAGQVYGWYFYNPNASVAYVQFFNTASGSVTLGTTAPVYSLGIPATSGANVMSETGIAHSTAITIAVTTTRAGSTSPGSSVDFNVFYK